MKIMLSQVLIIFFCGIRAQKHTYKPNISEKYLWIYEKNICMVNLYITSYKLKNSLSALKHYTRVKHYYC